jgi:hypothetical protein
LKKNAGSVEDVFIGYHPDTAPAVVLKVWAMMKADLKTPKGYKVMVHC